MTMTPCKFQVDATGTRCLVYSENRKKVHVQVSDQGLIALITHTLGVKAMSKAYAMAKVRRDGTLIIGDKLPAQDW